MKDTSAESATTIEGVKDLSAAPVVEDFSERLSGFNIELKQLLGKYELALLAEPKIVKGLIVADPVVRDERKAPDENKAPASDTPVA